MTRIKCVAWNLMRQQLGVGPALGISGKDHSQFATCTNCLAHLTKIAPQDIKHMDFASEVGYVPVRIRT